VFLDAGEVVPAPAPSMALRLSNLLRGCGVRPPSLTSSTFCIHGLTPLNSSRIRSCDVIFRRHSSVGHFHMRGRHEISYVVAAPLTLWVFTVCTNFFARIRSKLTANRHIWLAGWLPCPGSHSPTGLSVYRATNSAI
jgi:hypothetical protein